MELTELRRIKNTGKLPGFANGLPDWQPTPLFYGATARSIFDPTTLSAEMPTVKDLGIPSLGTVMPLKATPDQAKLITGDTSTGHNFDNGLQSLKDSRKTSPIKMEQVAGIVPAAIAFGSDLYTSGRYNRSLDELLAQGGQSQNSVGGIGYDEYNGVNMSSFNNEVKQENTLNTLRTAGSGAALGAAAGSIIPGLGTVAGGLIGGAVGLVGGLLGSSKRSKEAERLARLANQTASIYNTFNRSGAASARLQLDALLRNGNTLNQLRGYANGIPYAGYEGPAMAGSGETITEYGLIIGRLPGRPTKKDNIMIWVTPHTGIISNNIGKDGIRNSEWAYLHNDAIGGFARDAESRSRRGIGYKNGKLPGFAEGYLGNLIPSGLGMLASVGLYLDASGLDLATSTTRVQNRYERDALNRLAGLRINQYPIIDNLYGALRIADSGVNMSGLSGYQRAKVRLANLANTQKAISDAAINIQGQNNQYASALSNMEAQLGTQAAQRDLQGIMNDLKRLDEAHGRRQQGKQMGIYNFLNQLLSYYANEFKRRLFNDTMDLYRQQLALDRDKFNAAFPNYGKAKPTITMKPLTNVEIKRLGGLLLPYSSLAYTNDLYARMNAFKPKLIKR